MVKKLKKESKGNYWIFQNLCRESIARKWLKNNNINSWRNPVTPEDITQQSTSATARYSILFADGSRIYVCPFPLPTLSFDELAAAKCFAALSVELNENCKFGSVKGCIFLHNVKKPFEKNMNKQGGLESNEKLLHYLVDCGAYKARVTSFSIRLLLFGEPDAPTDGTNKAKRFCPVV